MKELIMRSHRLLQVSLFLFVFAVVGCENQNDVQPDALNAAQLSEANTKTAIHYGPATMIGDGSARVYVETIGGKPASLGIEFTEEVLSSLSHHMFDIALKLPGQAHATGIKTITFGWNPEGHAPQGVYTLPHFDFHFYMQTEGQIRKIAGGVDEGAYALQKKGVFPPFYGFGPPGAVPFSEQHMGVHWVDFRSPEFTGGVFSRTFIYGSHQDRVTFLEPMVTLDYLLALDIEEVIDVPALLLHESPGYYPNSYTIRHNSNGTFTIALTDLEWHNRHR